MYMWRPAAPSISWNSTPLISVALAMSAVGAMRAPSKARVLLQQLKDGDGVAYEIKKGLRVVTTVRIQDSALLLWCGCGCQSKEAMTPSELESHLGCGSRRRPYDHIHLPDGTSLSKVADRILAAETPRGQARYGCPKCRYLRAGCGKCRDQPWCEWTGAAV